MNINLEFIKKRRLERGFTQKQMAEKLGFCNASIYNKIELGHYKMPAEIMPQLAKILKCKITNFFIL
jgi:transcriptional regulator with XRE-family HTH domain